MHVEKPWMVQTMSLALVFQLRLAKHHFLQKSISTQVDRSSLPHASKRSQRPMHVLHIMYILYIMSHAVHLCQILVLVPVIDTIDTKYGKISIQTRMSSHTSNELHRLGTHS